MSRSYTATQLKQAVERHGGNRTKAAEALGMTRHQFRHAFAKVAAEPIPYTTERRLRDEVTRLKRTVDSMAREANVKEDFRASLFRLSETTPKVPRWVTSPVRAKSSAAEIPVLFTSDFQYGEVVDMNLNRARFTYNTEVAKRRYRTLLDKTLQLCRDERTRRDYPGIVYVRGGDTISGDIHQELRETNEIQSIPQAMEVAGLEIAGISRLADEFGQVVVLSVAGNHGRTTQKPMTKLYAATNFDTLIAWIIEAHFQAVRDSRVTFVTSMTGDIYTEFAGHPVLIQHGDQMGVKGGDGFIGLLGPVARGFKKTRLQYQAMGMQVGYMLAGHFHTAIEVENGCINGTLVGYSEYAKSLRLAPEPASQTLLFFHPDWGMIERRRVFVDPPETHNRSATLPETKAS